MPAALEPAYPVRLSASGTWLVLLRPIKLVPTEIAGMPCPVVLVNLLASKKVRRTKPSPRYRQQCREPDEPAPSYHGNSALRVNCMTFCFCGSPLMWPRTSILVGSSRRNAPSSSRTNSSLPENTELSGPIAEYRVTRTSARNVPDRMLNFPTYRYALSPVLFPTLRHQHPSIRCWIETRRTEEPLHGPSASPRRCCLGLSATEPTRSCWSWPRPHARAALVDAALRLAVLPRGHACPRGTQADSTHVGGPVPPGTGRHTRCRIRRVGKLNSWRCSLRLRMDPGHPARVM